MRSANIRDGQIIWGNLKYVSETTYVKYMTRGIPIPGDVLFTTEAPMGEVALVPRRKFSVAQRVMVLRPVGGVFVDEYLMYQLMSTAFRARLSLRSTGSTVSGVSSRNFRPAEVVVAPLAEQAIIAQEVGLRLSVADAEEKAIEAALKQAARLRQSILKRAFEGRLVPQDPSDEPAERLLERIRVEKAKKAATTRRGKRG